MPFSWLKNTKSDQCMSHDFCCSWRCTGANVSFSNSSFNLTTSSKALWKSCSRMLEAMRPHSALVFFSGWLDSVL